MMSSKTAKLYIHVYTEGPGIVNLGKNAKKKKNTEVITYKF